MAVDYSWAVVGSPDRNYLWVLARKPSLDNARWTAALEAVRTNGFDEAKLSRTRHTGAPQ